MGRGPGVRAASKSSLQIDFRYKGVRCRERISLPPTPANRKYVQRLKATIEHEIATGTFDYAHHFPNSPRARRVGGRDASTPLRDALLSYCETLANQLQPETVDEYRHDAEIIASGLKGKTLEGVTRAEIRQWISTLNLSKKRIDNLLIPLRGTFNQAVEDEIIEASPLAGFKVKRVERPRESIDPFTPQEIRALAGTDLGFLWEFWAWSGLRSGEIIGLEWPDVAPRWESIAIRRAVRVGRTKTPKSAAGTRVVFLVQPARRAVASLKQETSGPVFRNPNTGERWHEDRGLARAFRKACKEVGVRYRYPYQLRHTFATWALSSGENPKWAATQMGHKDMITFFRVYAKWMGTLDPQAGSKMAAAVETKAA